MRRDEVLQVLQAHRDVLRRLGALSLAVFGSVARDEAQADSDVDILVELAPPITFDRYMDVKFYLEDHLQVSVDLVTSTSLNPHIRPQVEREAIYVS
ncbi:MAG: DNA polymerase subunit beta [Cyanobacteria bacterium J069]|nr:MAG: DNA polymerase subunit beta [Cyanobacteria bacterium J069]